MNDRKQAIREVVELQKKVAGMYDTIEAQQSTIDCLRSNPTYMRCSNCHEVTKLVCACDHQSAVEYDNNVIDGIYDTIKKRDVTIGGLCAALEEQRRIADRLRTHIDEYTAFIDTREGVIDQQRTEIEQMQDDLRSSETRERVASGLHDLVRYWMKIAIKYPNVGRGFLDKTFDELDGVDKLPSLRDADTILDAIRGESR